MSSLLVLTLSEPETSIVGASFVPEAEKQSEGGKSKTTAFDAMPERLKLDAISSDINYDSKL